MLVVGFSSGAVGSLDATATVRPITGLADLSAVHRGRHPSNPPGRLRRGRQAAGHGSRKGDAIRARAHKTLVVEDVVEGMHTQPYRPFDGSTRALQNPGR